MKLFVAVAVAACLGTAAALTHSCTSGLMDILTCHRDTEGTPMISDTYNRERDRENTPDIYEHWCCRKVADLRASCDVADVFQYWPEVSDEDSLVLQFYLEQCFHHTKEQCTTAATNLLDCIKSEQDMDPRPATAGCCDHMATYRDQCIHREVMFQDEVGGRDDDTHFESERVIVDDSYKSYVDRDAVPGQDNAGRFERYFPDEEDEDTREGGLCGLYEYGERACTATRELTVNCVALVVSDDPTRDLDKTSCCWQSQRAHDFCAGEMPEESFYDDIPNPNRVQATFEECRDHDDDDNDHCNRVVHGHYFYQDGIVAPCGWRGTMGYATTWNNVEYCWKYMDNVHAAPECMPHGDEGSYDGPRDNNDGPGDNTPVRRLKRMS